VPNTTSPKVSIIICSYNRANYIIGAIDSLFNQTAQKSLYEVLVVDNNSSDNTKQLCVDYIETHKQTGYNIYYLEEKAQGASFARNTGAAKAQSPLLAFMDDDAVAASDFVQRIVAFFETSKGDGLGGRIIPKYIPAEPEWMSYYVSSLVGNFDYADHLCPFETGKYPLESNMIVKRDDFFSVGGFNTNLPGVVGKLRIGGEGKEFFYKLQAAGKIIYYDPLLCVQHVVEVSKLTREYMYRVASGIGRGERVRMLEKGKSAFYKKLVEYIIKLGASYVLAIKYTLQGKPAKAMPVVHFRIDAIKGLIGK